jgi:hypothetical protein
VGEAARIDDETRCLPANLLNAINQGALVIRLVGFDCQPKILSVGPQIVVDFA